MQALFSQLQAWYAPIRSELTDRKKILLMAQKAAIFTGLFLVLWMIGSWLPEGYDWQHYFKINRIHPIWTPWTRYIVEFLSPLGYGPVFAMTVIGLGVRTFRYSRSPLAMALAFLSLPTLWVLFMGNLDGLVLFGFLIMPAGIPMVLMKPQVAAFALLASKKWFVTAAVWGLLSLLVWGFWPVNMLGVMTPEWKLEYVQDINIFPWGLLVGLPLLWFSRGDQDLLMAAGSLATPHLFPYHFILLTPSLARMRWYWMLITWAVSWTPFLANWLGNWAWHFGNLMSICFWLGIYLNKSQPNSLSK